MDCVQARCRFPSASLLARCLTPEGLPVGYEGRFALPALPPPEIRNPTPVVETF